MIQWTQLEPGRLVARRRLLDFGPVVLRLRQHQTAFKGDGRIAEGQTLFGFTSGQTPVTRWNGLDVTGDDVATTRGSIDVFASAPETLYAITLCDDAYAQYRIPHAVREALARVPSSPSLVRSAQARYLRSYVRGLMEAGARPGRVSKAAICANVLWLLAAAVGDDGEALEPSRPQSRRLAAVHRCQEYIERCIGEPVTLPDLSAVSGLRPRSLINAFEAVTGTSPMAYLRARRLCRVRSVLENERVAKARIIDVATDWGFWHMGHFSSAYRAMFGETPSQTLTRSRASAGRVPEDARTG